MLFTLLVLSGSNDKAISAVLLAALIAFVVFMCIKKVRRDKTLPFAALSAAVAVLLLMSNNAYYLGKAKPLNGKEVIISGTLSDLPYEKDGSFYYVLKADTVNGEKSSLSFRVVSKTPLCIDVTDEVSLSAKAFLLGGDSDEILKYYKSKSLVSRRAFTGKYKHKKRRKEKHRHYVACASSKIDKRDTVPFAEHIRRTCGRALLR